MGLKKTHNCIRTTRINDTGLPGMGSRPGFIFAPRPGWCGWSAKSIHPPTRIPTGLIFAKEKSAFHQRLAVLETAAGNVSI
jgi:hypothetical protein